MGFTVKGDEDGDAFLLWKWPFHLVDKDSTNCLRTQEPFVIADEASRNLVCAILDKSNDFHYHPVLFF